MLRVLADLRPMGAVGPVALTEVRDVLADRLMSLEVDPPAHRYGRVFIGSPHQARGRAFRIVFVPGLAERLFPQKLREDPLLLDDLRRSADPAWRCRKTARTSNVCSCDLPLAHRPSACMSLSPDRDGRGATARAVFLCARSDARGHRKNSRPPRAGNRQRRKNERESCVARARQG